jgi:hypothetical protein
MEAPQSLRSLRRRCLAAVGWTAGGGCPYATLAGRGRPALHERSLPLPMLLD